MQTIVRHPKPVIAQVQGVATAAGCQLVASCDLAVASTRGALRDAGRQYRPLLLDADGGAVARRAAQGGDGDAADRRADRRATRRAASGSSIAWSRRRTWRRKPTALARFIASKPTATLKLGKQAFQHQLELGAVERLRLCRRSDGAEHAARRSRGRHRRVSGKAPAQMAGEITVVYPNYPDA